MLSNTLIIHDYFVLARQTPVAGLFDVIVCGGGPAGCAAAVAAAVEGGVSQFCTASALQMHQDAWFFCDEEAASKLKLKKYYAWRAEGELARA